LFEQATRKAFAELVASAPADPPTKKISFWPSRLPAFLLIPSRAEQ
jgi:hypothetical protein